MHNITSLHSIEHRITIKLEVEDWSELEVWSKIEALFRVSTTDMSLTRDSDTILCPLCCASSFFNSFQAKLVLTIPLVRYHVYFRREKIKMVQILKLKPLTAQTQWFQSNATINNLHKYYDQLV